MSNRITLLRTEFIDVTGNTKGYRLFDDYGQVYNNTLEAVPEDDLELLKLIIDQGSDDTTIGIVSHILESGKGIEIDRTFYDWDEIKSLFEES